MSYANQAALTDDLAFTARVSACAVEQALIFKDDGRPEIAELADMVLSAVWAASGAEGR